MVDESDCLHSIQPFQGETERTIVCSGILFPAFSAAVAATPNEALVWFRRELEHAFSVPPHSLDGDLTVRSLLKRLFPHTVLNVGEPVALWNLEDVYLLDATQLGADTVIKSIL